MKNIIENLNSLKETKNGKPILFFGFYFVFFIFIFLFIRFTGTKDALLQEYEKGNTSLLSSSDIIKNNYHYDFKVYLDGNLYNYYGKRLGNVESFKFNNNDYYKKNDNYFINNNGTWVSNDNPFIFREYMESSNVDLLVTNSYYVSKTSYDNGSIDYNLLLSSNTINKLLYDKDTDLEDIPCDVIVKTNDNEKINSIIFKLDNYCLNSDLCNSLKIELNYDLFGEVNKIDNPIE